MPDKATYTTIMSKDIQGYTADRNNYIVKCYQTHKMKASPPVTREADLTVEKNRQCLRFFLLPSVCGACNLYLGRAGDGMVGVTPSLLRWVHMLLFYSLL